eukprot:5458860-Prorocentrum_lima.AAC.1
MKEKRLSKSLTSEGRSFTLLIFCMGCLLFQGYLDIATSNICDTKDANSWVTNFEASLTSLIQFIKS